MPSRLGSLAPKLLPLPKSADLFYSSPPWRRLVVRIKLQRGPYCEECGSKHRVAGDHVVEMKDGGAPLDELNVKLRCARCHNRKTASEKAKRARGAVA